MTLPVKLIPPYASLIAYPVLIVFLGFLLPAEWIFKQIAFHAVVEAVGSVIAVLVSVLILVLRIRSEKAEMPVAVPMGLLSMGIVDGFHAAVMPGDSFVWLHSFATFIGGFFYAWVWLPAGRKSAHENQSWVFSVAVLTLAICLFYIFSPASVPVMLQEGRFTLLAELLNIIGGVFCVTAAIRLSSLYRPKGETHHQLFAFHCMLFGVAGLLFELSVIWDAAWWYWHLLRLAAYIIAFWLIISRFLKVEETYQKTSDLLEQFSENTPSIMSVKDVNGNYLHINRQFEKMYSLAREHVIGLSDHELFSEQFANAFRQDDLEVCKRGVPLTTEETVPAIDGYHTHHSVKFPLLNSRQEIYAIGCISTDISKIKHAEEALRVSEETYRLAMEATNDALWDWDVTSNRVYYSPAWKKILGITEAENVYETWAERIHPDDLKSIQISLQKHLNGDSENWEEDHRLKNVAGQWIWVRGMGKVVTRDENNQPLRMIGVMLDISAQKASDEEIWRHANFDSLTSLPNRKLFFELLGKEIYHSQRDSTPIWLFFLDLDGFKEVNDTLGHEEGDRLLIMVAERLKKHLRKSDTVARLGGDEFVIIIPGVSSVTDVDQIAINLLDTLAEKYPLSEVEVSVTASVGIANYPNDAETIEDLLKFADQSMYVAKKEGKNRFSYFTSALQQASLIRKQLLFELNKGLDNQEFQLFYQPIVNLADGKVHKAEALIRWDHPEKGLFSPAGFIPIAEETGVICDIGLWIFRQAFKQLKSWQEITGQDFQLSVNMSPIQIQVKDDKYHQWIDALHDSGLPKGSIVIEITEGLLLKGDSDVNRKLLRFREEGIPVAIDDFGTGYSSLSYLKEFDIDYLKIDRSFVNNLHPGSTDESICEAIIVMAHKLGLKVIAEGIETEQQKQLLADMNCDYGQGYLFSKPLSRDVFESTFLVNQR